MLLLSTYVPKPSREVQICVDFVQHNHVLTLEDQHVHPSSKKAEVQHIMRFTNHKQGWNKNKGIQLIALVHCISLNMKFSDQHNVG